MSVGNDAATFAYLRSRTVDELLEPAANVLAIVRSHLRFTFASRTIDVPDIVDHLATLSRTPRDEWSDDDIGLVCTIHAIGLAQVRFESVGTTLDPEVVHAHLRERRARYRALLEEEGEGTDEDPPWWVVAREVSTLREVVEQQYRRITHIDGKTWTRTEGALPHDAFNPGLLPSGVLE